MEAKKQSRTHLVVIVDLSPTTHLLSHSGSNGQGRSEAVAYEKWLNSVLAFCTTHLLMNTENKIHVIGSHFAGNSILYPLKAEETNLIKIREGEGQHEMFARLSRVIHHQIKLTVRKTRTIVEKMAKSQTSENIARYPLISGALAIGMCCIQRHKSEVESSRLAIIGANSYDTSAFSSQYMNFMNVFFTAQKLGNIIDACVIAPNELDNGSTASIFQQGCDLTGGLYLRVSNINAFLEYLVWTMLPDNETREKLVLPTQKKISYKAACFCHRTLIDIGYVCSVCLSIFCSFTPICSTCHTVFKLPNIPPLFKNKRKVAKVQS